MNFNFSGQSEKYWLVSFILFGLIPFLLSLFIMIFNLFAIRTTRDILSSEKSVKKNKIIQFSKINFIIPVSNIISWIPISTLC